MQRDHSAEVGELIAGLLRFQRQLRERLAQSARGRLLVGQLLLGGGEIGGGRGVLVGELLQRHWGGVLALSRALNSSTRSGCS